jgi:hypothetical protein
VLWPSDATALLTREVWRQKRTPSVDIVRRGRRGGFGGSTTSIAGSGSLVCRRRLAPSQHSKDCAERIEFEPTLHRSTRHIQPNSHKGQIATRCNRVDIQLSKTILAPYQPEEDGFVLTSQSTGARLDLARQFRTKVSLFLGKDRYATR